MRKMVLNIRIKEIPKKKVKTINKNQSIQQTLRPKKYKTSVTQNKIELITSSASKEKTGTNK
jgi:hypothetical protein